MPEQQGCRVTFKNTEKQISIKLVYTKRDKDVDIRDFLCKIISNDKLEVQFKKGLYELKYRGHEDVLTMVPSVIKTFQEFYEDSFEGRAVKPEHIWASANENAHHVNEQRMREAQLLSEKPSGHSDHGPEISHSRLHTEEPTQGDNKKVSLISANRDHHADENETVPEVRNSNDGRKLDIKTPGTTNGGAHHGDPKEGNKGPNPKPESGDEHKENEKKKSDSTGRKEEKDNNDEQIRKYKSEKKDDMKDAQKNPSSTKDKKPEHDEEHRERSGSNARDKTKGSEHGEQKPRKNASQVDNVDDESGSHGSNYGATGIRQGGRERSGSNGKEKTKSSEHGEQKTRKNASQVDDVGDEAGSHGSNYGATGITQGSRERSGSNARDKAKGSEHGEQKPRENASQVDNVDDDADAHESNYGATGITQGGRGHDGSERSKVNSTMSNTMNVKDKHDGDRAQRSTVATAEMYVANEGHGEGFNAKGNSNQIRVHNTQDENSQF